MVVIGVSYWLANHAYPDSNALIALSSSTTNLPTAMPEDKVEIDLPALAELDEGFYCLMNKESRLMLDLRGGMHLHHTTALNLERCPT